MSIRNDWPSQFVDDRGPWCECEHPLSWHDDEGVCRAPMGADEISIAYDCSCTKFTEAQGDTLESLGVDVL